MWALQMQEQEKKITFLGCFSKFATTADGGAKITFELSQDQIQDIQQLLSAQGILLNISVEVHSASEH